MPLRFNNVGLGFRLTMLLQISAVGAIVPSYDIESRNDGVETNRVASFLTLTLFLNIYFGLMELHELCNMGPVRYFSNMWNLMDFANFALYGMLFDAMIGTRRAVNSYSCSEICVQVGYHDPWLVFRLNSHAKFYIGFITTLQWLKVREPASSLVYAIWPRSPRRRVSCCQPR